MAKKSEPELSSTIDINLITIDRPRRQRTLIEVEDLKDSIARVGLLQFPVVQRGTYELRAGERRLTACRELGWERIPVRWFDDLDPITAKIIELEENVKRKALPWQDLVRSTAEIHGLFCDQSEGWTPRQSQEALGISQSHFSMCLRIASAMDEERINSADGMREAYNILLRRDQRNCSDKLDEMLGLDEPTPDPEASVLSELPEPATELPPGAHHEPTLASSQPSVQQRARPASPPIRCASFLDWLDSDEPEKLPHKFNFVHCDFPYGVNLFDSKQGRGAEPSAGYEDTPELYFSLLEAFCKNLDRFMASSGHLLFWFSGKHRAPTMKLFRDFAPSLEFYPYDLIWHKSDNAGIAGDHRRHPRHTHETALFATRSRRNILEVVADSISAPTAKTMHASTKPIPVLTHFFRMLVDENSRVFDPTCGSGTALRVADAAGAQAVLGLEIDPEAARIALREFNEARGLRKLSKQVA